MIRITDYSLELHGDRHFADDPALICGIGIVDGMKLMIIGQEKGRGTKSKVYLFSTNISISSPDLYIHLFARRPIIIISFVQVEPCRLTDLFPNGIF